MSLSNQRPAHGRSRQRLCFSLSFIVALAIIGVGFAGGAADGATPRPVDGLLRDLDLSPLAGNPPPFTLRDLDGTARSLESLKGRAALLYFWATW